MDKPQKKLTSHLSSAAEKCFARLTWALWGKTETLKNNPS